MPLVPRCLCRTVQSTGTCTVLVRCSSVQAPRQAATNTKVATKVGDQDRTEFEIRADAAFTECLDGLKPIQEA